MAGELDCNKTRVRLNVSLELSRKVIKTFAKPGDPKGGSCAFIRALEEGCRDIVLTKSDYAFIGKQVEENFRKRMKAREAKAAHRKLSSGSPEKGPQTKPATVTFKKTRKGKQA